MMKNPRYLLGLFFLLALTACAGSHDDEEEDTKQPKPICPQVAILQELKDIHDYGAETPEPAQLVAAARMLKVTGDCAYLKDGIDVRFDLNLIAERGKRLGGLHASFPYFVSVVDPDGSILTKEIMTAEVGFSSESKLQTSSEALHVFIPLLKDRRETGPNYRVLVGFQLTKEQREQQE